MADVNISKYRASVVRDGSKPASPGFVVSEGQDPVNPPGTNNFVPYTGATANVELGEFGVEAGFVTLDTTPTNIPTEQGAIYWDDTRSTAALIMNGTLQHIGQDSFFYVKNSSGSTIPKGTCVGFAGTDGGSGHLLVTPFLANGSVPSTYFMGVTCESIANGSFGQVMHFGELTGINTSGFTAGALLYASTTVAGGFQTTVPVAPNNIILVAAAVNSKNNGAIVVRPTLGSNINSDEGVKITSPTTGDLLQLQAGGLWENKTLAQVIGSAYVPSTRTLTINGTTQDLSADRTFNVGTVTSVGLSSATSGVTIGGSPVTGVGAFTLTIATASGSQQGLLSADDWTTFNNKIGGTLATGQVAFGTAANTIGGGNNLFWDNVNGRFGVGTSTPSSRAEIAQTSTGNLDYLTIYNSGGGAVNDQTALSFEHGGNRRSNKIFSTLESSTSTALGFVTTASTVEAERWRITSTGILQSNGAQTIQTSTGNLTLATAAGNGNIILSPNGTGRVGINTNTPLGTLDIRVAGNGGSASNASNSIIISPLSISDITEGEIGSQIILNARRNGVSDGVSIAAVMQSANFDLASMAFYTHPNISGSPRIECMRIFGASGNLLLQNGGTFTDSGFRLDVNGTTRLNGLQTFQGTTASDTAPLGPELTTTGTGTNWTGTDFATGYTHVVGSTASLTTSLAAVVGTYYQITYTVTGRTAGSFTINYGGTSTVATGTGATGPVATTTANLEIVPTSGFDGTIVLSVRTISNASATTSFTTSGGTVVNEIRANNTGNNTFVGLNTGRRNTTGVNNTFLGMNSGVNNTTASNNTFVGRGAGFSNSIGGSNSFFGTSAGLNNTTGSNNSFFGRESGNSNTTGTSNSFFGVNAGASNTTGIQNTFLGVDTAANLSTGSNNLMAGVRAGRFIVDGTTPVTIANNSVFLGFDTRANADNETNQIVIGHTAIGGGSNTVVIGNSSIVSNRFFGTMRIGTINNGVGDFVTTDANGVLTRRTAAQTLTDIGAQAALTLTTTGTSGAATLVGSTLNIPIYSPDLSGYVPTSRTITINGTTQDLSANRSFNVGTVTSVGLSSATSGVTIGSTPVTSSGTITLAIATATATQNGLLSSTDWSTFNNKQNALTNPVTGTGTTNYLPKFTGSTTVGNSQVFDNGTNVGINQTSPTRTLDILGASGIGTVLKLQGASGTTTYLQLAYNGATNAQSGYIGYNSSSQMQFFTNDTLAMTIDSNRNLGLGVTPSAWFSTVKAIDISTATALWAGGNGQPALGYNVFVNTSGNLIYKTSEFASRYEQISGQHQWYNAPSGTAGNTISFTQAMTLTSSGNLLVGTTSDNGARLQVSGSIHLLNGGNRNIRIGSATNYYYDLQSTNDDFQIIEAGSTPRLTIKYPNGNVGIGTTSPTNSRLLIAGTHVAGNSILGVVPVGDQVATIGLYNSSGVRKGLFYSNTGFVRVESDADPIQIYAGGVNGINVTTGGNVLIGTTTDNSHKLRVNGTGYFDTGIKTGNPVGSTTNDWLLGRALVTGTSTPDRWIRVQIGNLYYDILAVYMGSV